MLIIQFGVERTLKILQKVHSIRS